MVVVSHREDLLVRVMGMMQGFFSVGMRFLFDRGQYNEDKI